MPVLSSSLLREWDLLQEQIIPPLLASRRPRVWSVGNVADAVAVAAAYNHARGDRPGDIRAYSGDASGELTQVSFSLTDIRCMPVGSRRAAFRRDRQTWIPGDELAEAVVLANPSQPVDLVTLRPSEAAQTDLAQRAVDKLRDGGHLLLLEPAGSFGPEGLQRVDRSGRLFQKCTRGRSRARRDQSHARSGDEEALTLAGHQAQSELVAGHAGLAKSLARRFSHHGEARDDLEQVALMALVKAARRYDRSRETSFSTYATASILGELKRHFRDKTWMMRVPRSIQESYLAIKDARETLTHELSASPTIQQIADRLGISDERVLEAMEAGENYWPESLDVAVFEGEGGREVPVLDAGLERALERQELTLLLPRLAPRERLILKRLYFDGWTQRQVAEEVGVSQMQVSRLLSRTIDKLREWAAE
jgi:RNA polymerase sigma-B factor